MKYYTKEWFGLMNFGNFTDGVTVIPDGEVTDEDIARFYAEDLASELERAEKRCARDNGDIPRELLSLLNGALPFSSPGTFDADEVKREFEASYKSMLRYGTEHYPSWVRETVDRRLLALWRMPESVFERLSREERSAEEAFERINAEASAELSAQEIPPELLEFFRFHDASVISLSKKGRDAELVLSGVGGEEGLFTVVRFHNVSLFEREKGLVIRKRERGSNCAYLYDELYRKDGGYELHMLLWTEKALRYVTVACGDVSVTHCDSMS